MATANVDPDTQPAAEGGTDEPQTGRRLGWRYVVILTIAYTCAFADRQVLSLLVEPIKHDLGVTDTQLSLLLGFAFSFFYSAMNLPAGYLVDRFGRRGLIAGGVVIWSTMTMICGFSRNYLHLLVGRAGVGISEAVIAPASYSLVRDKVPLSHRGRAFSVLAMAPYFGSSVALIGGGALLAAATAGSFDAIPVLNTLRPWQVVLVMLGLLGLPIACLFLALPADHRVITGPKGQLLAGLLAAARYMIANWRTYLPLIGYSSLGSVFVFANGAWMPTMIARKWEVPLSEVGYVYGTITAICAPVGLLLMGMLIDRLSSKGKGMATFAVVVGLLAVLSYALVPIMPSVNGSWVAKAVGLLFAGSFYAIGSIIVAKVTASEMVGRVTAVYLLFQSLVGAGLGPLIVALIADNLASGPEAIAIGMLSTSLLIGIPASLMPLFLRREMR